MYDPAAPGVGPVELGRHEQQVAKVVVLSDGRVVTGGWDGRVLAWDPAAPSTGPVELGRHDGIVTALVALPDGRVVTGAQDNRVLVWDPAAPGADVGQLSCSVRGLATSPLEAATSYLVIAHQEPGLSYWSVRK